jgi:hypothetical protein
MRKVLNFKYLDELRLQSVDSKVPRRIYGLKRDKGTEA